MSNVAEKENKRLARHSRLRKKVVGTTQRPRLCVHRSARNLIAQIIDDSQNKVIFGMSTLGKQIKSKVSNGGNVKAATELGEMFAAEALKKGVKQVSFDRGGYLFHGRVKAFADGARKGGLEF